MLKVLLYIFFAVGVLFVTLATTASRMENTFQEEYEITIEAPVTTVYGHLESLDWRDSSAVGQLTITDKAQNNFIKYRLDVVGWGGYAEGEMQLLNMVNSTKLVWTIEGHRNGLMTKILWMVFKIEKSVYQDFMNGFDAIKSSSEGKSSDSK